VRFLFAFVGGTGHLMPQVPVAQALRDAGHEVAFSTLDPMVPEVRKLGFEAYGTIYDRPARGIVPLVAPSMERELRTLREVFAGRIRELRLASVPEHAAAFGADAIVRDEFDFGAELPDVPCASVLISAAAGFPPAGAIALEPRSGLLLRPFPPSLRADGLGIRPCATADTNGDAIYFTLGTVFNRECGDLFERVIEAMDGLEAIVTVGRVELPVGARGIRVEHFIPQADVLPHCRAVISHAGSGSLVGALAHGLPMVLLPLGADQLVNAPLAARLGFARVLDVMTATPKDIRRALDDVLHDPAYRRAARRIQAEIAALPGPEAAVEPLVQLRTQSRRVIET
jgi:UDP:flavonoid glycosyltransferase YjiC (YdhE family)